MRQADEAETKRKAKLLFSVCTVYQCTLRILDLTDWHCMTNGHCFRPGLGGFHLPFSLFPCVPASQAGRQTGITLFGSSSSDPGGLACLGDRRTLAHLHLAQSPSDFGTEESGVSSTLLPTGATSNGRVPE